MPITVGTPNGPFVIGPGATITATSDLLALANPPYHWTFSFEAPDSTFFFQHLATTTNINESAQIHVQWTDLDTPAPLLPNIHAKPGDTIKVTTEVRDDGGLIIDGPLVTNVQWIPEAWAHLDALLVANSIVARVAGGGDTADKIDLILAAVYQRWPDA